MTVNILRKDEKKTECRAKSETLCTATFTGKKKKKKKSTTKGASGIVAFHS